MNKYPQAYLEYLIYFQAQRDYFECHEVMEAFWKAHPADARSPAFVGLIQLAVGLYHQRRGNITGAIKMLQGAENRLSEQYLQSLGLHPVKLREAIAERIERLKAGEQGFADIDLPIEDPKLLEQCQQECVSRGLIWSSPSDYSNEHLIHKHKLRDRSVVIEERNEQMRKRQLQKGISP